MSPSLHANPECVVVERMSPWEANPYQLINWWDMEQFSAAHVFLMGTYLEAIADFIKHADGEETFDIEGTKKTVGLFRTDCSALNLNITLDALDDVERSLAKGLRQFEESVRQLQNVARWEMEKRLFLFVPAERAKRYGKPNLFGIEVTQNFPDAGFDIAESGNCYAAGRYTASVFHLMRVVELGLAAFGNEFQLTLAHTNWHPFIEQIESKIRDYGAKNKTPTGKDTFEKYNQIASSFMIFKDAWRNYTAHARGKYTEDEADAIFRNVCSFMQKLAQQGIKQ